MTIEEEACLFSGTSHPELAQQISEHIKIDLGKIKIEPFPDGEIFVQIEQNVRGKNVFVVQSLAHRPNHYLMELLIIVDALKRASARSIVLLIPYYSYSRQDRKDRGRVPITAKLVANLIETAGATRVLTMDLHADQIQGFFDIPSDNLYARPELVKAVEKLDVQELVVGSPDVGGIKLAKAFADQFKSDIMIIDKRRLDAKNVELSPIIGEVKGKVVLFVDDMCSTAATLCKAADACMDAGAKKVFSVVTHGVFVDDALEKIEKSQIEKVYVSNTIPQGKASECSKIEVVSIARLFGEAMKSILYKNSISSLFNP